MTNYKSRRVNMKENVNYTENTSKEEIELDEKRKQNELLNLGYIGKLYLNLRLNDDISKITSSNNKNVNKEKENTLNFITELNSVDDKVKQECIKIYTGGVF